MKTLRKYLPVAFYIVGFIFVLGLVGETPLERKESTEYVRSKMEAAKLAELERLNRDEWVRPTEWAEQFVPPASQIALK